MQLTRKSTNQTLQLSDSLEWTDELTWSEVEQSNERGIDGTFIVQSGLKIKGRPITLQAPSDMAWLPRSTVKTLRDWSGFQGEQFTLTFNAPISASYNVIFDNSQQAIEAKTVQGFAPSSDANPYNVTLKFIEVPSA